MKRLRSNFINGLKHLPVRLTPTVRKAAWDVVVGRNRAPPRVGIRVIDQACGLCGRLLAEHGGRRSGCCRQPPGGAASRHAAPFHNDLSLYFTVRNLGKKSVTLDMDSADARRRLEALLDTADVWIRCHRALDLNRREILDRHPQLIITSITPFGFSVPGRIATIT